MAIIFNIDRAIADSSFNVLGLSIPMLLENQVEEFQKGSKIDKLFVNKSLQGYSQSYHTSVTHGGFRPSEDMEIAKLHDWEDSYGKTFTAQTWKDSFAISQEAMEDNKDLEINKKVKDFGTNYGRTREEYCAATAAGALVPSYAYGGKRFSVSSIDSKDADINGAKQLYFDRYHATSVKVANAEDFEEMTGYAPWVNAGAADANYPGNSIPAGTYATPPQSNKFLGLGGGGTQFDTKGLNLVKVNPAEGDTAANMAVYDQIRFFLDKIRELGRLHRDYDGRLVPLEYSRIIVPSNSIFNKAIRAALGASLTEGPFEGPLSADKYELVEWTYLNGKPGFGPKELGFLMVDPSRNDRELGFTLWDRIPLTVKSYLTDGNDTMVWYGRGRFKADTCDPYAVVYCALGALRDLSPQAFSGTTTTKYTATASAPITTSNATFIDLTDFQAYINPYGYENYTAYTVSFTGTTVTSDGSLSAYAKTDYLATLTAGEGYTLPTAAAISVVVGSTTLVSGVHYTYDQSTGALRILGGAITGNVTITVTEYAVTFNGTQTTSSGTAAAFAGNEYNAIFTPSSTYTLPETVTVTIGGESATVTTDYTYNSETGAFKIPAAKVTGVITIAVVSTSG